MPSEAWQEVAERFRSAAERRDPEAKLERDHALGLLGELRGRRLLELGCGRGEFSLLLSSRGACVVGLDASALSLREGARAALESGLQQKPCFVVGRPADPATWPRERFDRVLALRALELDSLEREFFEALAVRLGRGGAAVLGFAHPYRQAGRIGAPLERLIQGSIIAGLRLLGLRELGLRADQTPLLLLVSLSPGQRPPRRKRRRP